MIDGSSKTITITDGVENPYITNTTYQIFYPADDLKTAESMYYCKATVHYSDDLSHVGTANMGKIVLPNVLTINGFSKKQFQFYKLNSSELVTEVNYWNGSIKNTFPYLIDTSEFNGIFLQRWSDGRFYQSP